ncbi:hypothetical protein CPB85DRAFT_412054 [Mucidula mucida]|nr:hypothetical protein CPB85DRAFT_412054 [Mucidula mucida]
MMRLPASKILGASSSKIQFTSLVGPAYMHRLILYFYSYVSFCLFQNVSSRFISRVLTRSRFPRPPSSTVRILIQCVLTPTLKLHAHPRITDISLSELTVSGCCSAPQ